MDAPGVEPTQRLGQMRLVILVQPWRDSQDTMPVVLRGMPRQQL